MTIVAERVFFEGLEALIGQKYGLKIYGSSVDEIFPPRHRIQLPNLFFVPLLTTVCSIL
jgi:hypothetical protein